MRPAALVAQRERAQRAGQRAGGRRRRAVRDGGGRAPGPGRRATSGTPARPVALHPAAAGLTYRLRLFLPPPRLPALRLPRLPRFGLLLRACWRFAVAEPLAPERSASVVTDGESEPRSG